MVVSPKRHLRVGTNFGRKGTLRTNVCALVYQFRVIGVRLLSINSLLFVCAYRV